MSGFITVLDPDEVSKNRTALDLNSGTIRVLQDGIDWGDDAIQAYESDSKTGSVMVDYRKPNRTISIPLAVFGTTGNRVSDKAEFDEASKTLRQKVGLIERQGGWLKRDAGNGKMYADIVTATLTFPDHWGEYGVEGDVVLKLEALPDFYGDEVALPVVSSTNGILSAVITTGAIANLIPDPSFEYDAVGSSPASWADNSTGSLLAVTEAWAEDGSRALEYEFTNSDGSTAYPGVAVVVDSGITAGAEHYFRIAYEEVTNTMDGGPSLAVTFNDGDGNYIEHDGFTTVTVADGVCSGFVTAPSGAAEAEFQFFYTSAVKDETLHVYVDAALAVASSTEVPYSDGDTVGFEWSGTPGDSATTENTIIEGDYPARCRIVVNDTANTDRHGLIYGLRGTNFDAADTAKSVYEAEDLSPINGSTLNPDDTAASGGNEVQFTIPTGGGATWTPFLLSSLSDGSPLTHQGTYRVLARMKSSADLSVRLAWSVGTLAVPTTNEPVAVVNGPWWMCDLGVVRLDQQPVGANAWYGVLQVNGAETDTVVVDQLIILPLDDSSGQMVYTPNTDTTPPPTVQQAANTSTSLTNETGDGTLTWDVTSVPGYAYINGTNNGGATSGVSEYLAATGYGFAIPSDATVLGIVVSLGYIMYNGATTDHAVRIIKGGTIGTADRSAGDGWVRDQQNIHTRYWGSSSDQWGDTWTPNDINASDFGFGIEVNLGPGTDGGFSLAVETAQITVYYQLESGFAIPDDAVLYATRTAELRTEGMYRTYDGTVYGPISTVLGDLPRLPPSGAEGRSCELVIRPTVGNFADEADGTTAADLADFTAQVFYRPSYLFRP